MTKLSDAEFIAAWHRCGASPARVARHLNIPQRGVYQRRVNLERSGHVLRTIRADDERPAANKYGPSIWQTERAAFKERADITVKGGQVFAFSDAHYWPGEPSLAHRALVILAGRLKPKAIIADGDIFDGHGISRHDVLGWAKIPSVADELGIVKQRLDEISRQAPDATLVKTIGNHDSRFDRRLATEAAEFDGVRGFSLQDHLPEWPIHYVCMINGDIDPVLVMHNFKGGQYAPANNAIHSGCHVVTGHLHAQQRISHTDYFKTKYGIDAGCLADPDHEAFAYCMGRPRNWRSGFVILTFDAEGRLLPPEFCEIQKYGAYKRAVYRGEVICDARTVDPKELLETPGGARAASVRVSRRASPRGGSRADQVRVDSSRARRGSRKAGRADGAAKRKDSGHRAKSK